MPTFFLAQRGEPPGRHCFTAGPPGGDDQLNRDQHLVKTNGKLQKQLEKDTSWDILRFFPFFFIIFCTSMRIFFGHSGSQDLCRHLVGNRWLYQMIPTCDGDHVRRRLCLLLWTLSGIFIGLQQFGSESADPQMAILISNMVIKHIIHCQIFGTLLRIS